MPSVLWATVSLRSVTGEKALVLVGHPELQKEEWVGLALRKVKVKESKAGDGVTGNLSSLFQGE